MKQILLLITCVLAAISTQAQKPSKYAVVSSSDMLGIPLPATTKKDSRGLSVTAANALLQAEIAKGVTLTNTEVFELPLKSAYNLDSLMQALQQQGWTYSPLPGKTTKTDEYAWITKGNKRLISFVSIDKYQKSFYVAETSGYDMAMNQSLPSPDPLQQPPPPVVQPQPEMLPQTQPQQQPINQPAQQNTPAPATPGKYTYTTTTYDDGWSATEREDWVECNNGNRKYLIHYPNEKTKFVSGTTEYFTREAWNALVAPRWSSMTDFFLMTGNLSYPGACFASANMTDASGRTYYVVLFNKGRSPWMEFIYPDKQTFIKDFGVDRPDYYFTTWEPLEKMQWTRRFAVAPQDLVGKWTSDFGGMLQYVNATTGADAGMNTHSSTTVYEFFPNGTYTWSLKLATGYVGSIKYAGVDGKGQFKIIDNWNLWLSDIEGKPRNYKIMFEPVKGGRILWIDGKEYGRSK